MSCYEWAQGDIILPAAAFSPVRKEVQDAMHAKVKREFDESQRFWKSLTPAEKSDWDKFRKALWSRRYDNDTSWLIEVGFHRRAEKPRRVLTSDIEWPTNRTTEFHESDLTLIFQRKTRTVTFSVGENNHAREHADATTLAKVFYEQMLKVCWTHGTGGVILGNDEYNRESGYDQIGAGGSYVVTAYGYIGAKEAPVNVSQFLNGKGQPVHVERVVKRGGIVGKVVAGREPNSGYGGSARRAVW